MCLTIRPAISDRDIVCWKRFRVTPNGTHYTPHQHFKWERNTEQRSKLGIVGLYSGNIEINEGLHAHTTKEKALQSKGVDQVIRTMIIPFGTPHYYGTNSDIVATSMRMVGAPAPKKKVVRKLVKKKVVVKKAKKKKK